MNAIGDYRIRSSNRFKIGTCARHIAWEELEDKKTVTRTVFGYTHGAINTIKTKVKVLIQNSINDFGWKLVSCFD